MKRSVEDIPRMKSTTTSLEAPLLRLEDARLRSAAMKPSVPLCTRFDVFELDEREVRLTRAGAPVTLAPKAFAVLCALARAPGRLLTKNAVLDEVWGHRHVSESVLKTTIARQAGTHAFQRRAQELLAAG